jgi:hypothetical protein
MRARGAGTKLLYMNDVGSADASGCKVRCFYKPEDVEAI